MSASRQKIRQSSHSPRLTMKLLDSLAIVIGLMVLIVWLPEANSRSTIVIGLVAVCAFGIISEMFGLYRNWRGVPFEREATCTVLSWLGTIISLAALSKFALYTTEISGNALWLWTLFGIVFTLAFRLIYRTVVRFMINKDIRTRKFAVIGCNDLGQQLIDSIGDSPDLGLKFSGFYDDRTEDRLPDMPDGMTRLGGLEPLLEKTQNGEVQVVFITIKMSAEDRIRRIISQFSDSTASVYIVPDLFVFQLMHSRWTEIHGVPVVSVFENPFYGVDGALKRVVDVAIASAGLLVCGIPMMIIALLVKLTSKGPVLFKQSRYGLDGKAIKVWKFRSMSVCENGDTVSQAKKGDMRITKVGGILRKTSLDELPQLFNVIEGTMSLVGPRPHANAHNEYYRKEIEGYMLRHKVKPGITGLAQVNGCRGETETIDKMERRVFFDHQYIREWSIWLDLKIIFQTFSVVLSQKNAY